VYSGRNLNLELEPYNLTVSLFPLPNQGHSTMFLISLDKTAASILFFPSLQPLPLPDALFDQLALRDENVRWDLHQCKNFECLNTRKEGDCRNCFNLQMEANRWKGFYRRAAAWPKCST